MVEEYLEALYTLTEGGKPAKTTDLARALSIAPASVTEMLQKLGREGYVRYRRYHGVSLTEKGQRFAASLKRRHRLCERFLTDILGVKTGDVHGYACRMEHILTPELSDTICRLLGHPTTCPDDMMAIPPCERGEVACRAEEGPGPAPLSDLKTGESGVVRIVVEMSGTRDTLARLGLQPGKPVRAEGPAGGGFRVSVDGGPTVNVGRNLASRIFVERRDRTEP